jgi:hypothetical protein
MMTTPLPPEFSAAGKNGLQICLRVKASGHNNTKQNPVFRRMPRIDPG